MQSLAGDFEFTRISLPYGDDTAKRMTDLLVDEAIIYPSGATNDLLMALWFVKFNYKKLMPTHNLPTRRKGSGTGGGWSWLKQMKGQRNPQDEAYRRWRKQDETRKVAVG